MNPVKIDHISWRPKQLQGCSRWLQKNFHQREALKLPSRTMLHQFWTKRPWKSKGSLAMLMLLQQCPAPTFPPTFVLQCLASKTYTSRREKLHWRGWHRLQVPRPRSMCTIFQRALRVWPWTITSLKTWQGWSSRAPWKVWLLVRSSTKAWKDWPGQRTYNRWPSARTSIKASKEWPCQRSWRCDIWLWLWFQSQPQACDPSTQASEAWVWVGCFSKKMDEVTLPGALWSLELSWAFNQSLENMDPARHVAKLDFPLHLQQEPGAGGVSHPFGNHDFWWDVQAELVRSEAPQRSQTVEFEVAIQQEPGRCVLAICSYLLWSAWNLVWPTTKVLKESTYPPAF